MATVVRMPSVMANATEAAIQAWLVQEGTTVEVGTPLAEIETEKAVVDYASEESGTVGRLIAETGTNLEVGAPIAVILAAGEGADAIAPALAAAGVVVESETAAGEPPAGTVEAQAEGEQPDADAPDVSSPSSPASDPVVGPASGSRSGRRFASPIVRRLARERGIDLDALTGSGPDGRIVRRDLDGLPGTTGAKPTEAPASTVAPAAPVRQASPTSAAADHEDVPLSGMRRAIARRLTESKTTVPHFYVTADVRMDRLLALRRELNEASPRRISVNDLVVKAVAAALVDVPAANAVWNGDSIRRFSGVDLAVAVAVSDGLLTPVVRGADRLGIAALSAAIAELADRAKAGRLRQEELEGGSFAISNLGMYGVDSFSAILNPPQSGILAVGAAKPRPVVEEGALAVGTVMTVTLSADHRVLDGAVAAEWLAAFVRRLESPLSLLI